MDLKSIKQKATKLKNQAVDYGAKKLVASKFTITTKQELEKFINKSIETTFTNKETLVEKKYSHRVIVIFWDEETEFFKKALYQLPVIFTKGFSQNTPVKLAKSNIEEVDLKEYKVEQVPSLVVFENTKLYKVISWEENIIKLVKSFSLDINKVIEEI